MKNLALVGYGKMGRTMEQLAPEYDFRVCVRLDSKNNANGELLTADTFREVDAAIEFSSPEAGFTNVSRLAELAVPTVTGTTGWFDRINAVRAVVEATGTGLVWSPNFSIGVAVFNRVVATAASLLRDEAGYGAWAWEIHHDAKKDAPSGTLLRLVETMRTAGYDSAIDINSNRAGKHPGTHEIGFDSAADTITLRHTARSREGFARGALKAAQWILERKGVFTFEDVLFGDQR